MKSFCSMLVIVICLRSIIIGQSSNLDTQQVALDLNVDSTTGQHHVLYEVDFSFALYRRLSAEDALNPAQPSVRSSLAFNIGYYRDVNDRTGIGAFGYFKGLGYQHDALNLLGVKGRIIKFKSGRLAYSFSPGVALWSNLRTIKSFPGYSFDFGIDNRKSLGIFATLDILRRTDDKTDAVFYLGLKLKGKTATIASAIIAALLAYTVLAVSGST